MINIELDNLQNGSYPVGHATEKNAETLEIAFDNDFFSDCNYYKFQAIRPDRLMLESEELEATPISGVSRQKITLSLDAQYLVCSGIVRCQVIGCKLENDEIVKIKASDVFTLKVLASVAEEAKRIAPDEGGAWEQLLHDVSELKTVFGGKSVVNEITDESTDNEIPSAKAVEDYVDDNVTTESAFEIVASESGTSDASSEITINLIKPCKEVQIAINVPPPPSNLAYCQAIFHTVGDNSFTVSTNVAINASHTKSGLCFFEIKAGVDGLRVTSASTANIGRSYAQIQNEAVATNSGGYTGYVGRGFNYQTPTDYYIDRIVLKPTNSSSAFEAGTNYIVLGR